MKRSRIFVVTLILIGVGAGLFWWHCETKKVGPTEPIAQEIEFEEREFNLRGRIIDSITRLGIPGVNVLINGVRSFLTDAEGYYQVDALSIGSEDVDISAAADGYGPGRTTAFIDAIDRVAVVRTISLRPLNEPVLIGQNGGIAETLNNESITGRPAVIQIPENALDETISVSITPFEGIHVPGIAPDGMLNLVTFHLGAASVILNIPAVLTLPLPLLGMPGDSLVLLRFDQNSYLWEATGDYAIIDPDGETATANIDRFGTYSLGVQGSYTEELNEEMDAEYVDLDTTTNFDTISYLPTIEYPEGRPDEISPVWLKNTVSQNTTGDGRISFYDSTTFNINYAPIPSDTSYILKEPMHPSDCERWICKYYLKRVIFCWCRVYWWEVVRLRWMTINGRLEYRIVNIFWVRRIFCYCRMRYWWRRVCYFHDQGGY